MKFRVLVVDDEEGVREAVRRRMERDGYEVSSATGVAEAEKTLFESDPFDVVVTDMSMEKDDSGLGVLSAAFARDPLTEVIVMTAYGTVGNAVESMRRGAFDYVEKNVPDYDTFELLSRKTWLALEQRSSALSALDVSDEMADIAASEAASG